MTESFFVFYQNNNPISNEGELIIQNATFNNSYISQQSYLFHSI